MPESAGPSCIGSLMANPFQSFSFPAIFGMMMPSDSYFAGWLNTPTSDLNCEKNGFTMSCWLFNLISQHFLWHWKSTSSAMAAMGFPDVMVVSSLRLSRVWSWGSAWSTTTEWSAMLDAAATTPLLEWRASGTSQLQMADFMVDQRGCGWKWRFCWK